MRTTTRNDFAFIRLHLDRVRTLESGSRAIHLSGGYSKGPLLCVLYLRYRICPTKCPSRVTRACVDEHSSPNHRAWSPAVNKLNLGKVT